MNPHQELIQSAINVMLYDLGTSISPRPDWLNPNSGTCWLWKGSFSTEDSATRKTYNRVYSRKGVKLYKVQRKGLPIKRLGSGRTVSIHRLLYMLYRQPTLPVTQMRKVNCTDYHCVNPWHWEGCESQARTKTPTPWPAGCLLSELADYFYGLKAEDDQTKYINEFRKKVASDELLIEIQKTKILMEKDEFNEVNSGKFSLADKPKRELHDVCKKHWHIDPLDYPNPYPGLMEDYDLGIDYKIHFQKYYGDKELSDEIKRRIEWYSVPLPILSKKIGRDVEDYWIGFNMPSSVNGILEDCTKKAHDLGRKCTASDIMKDLDSYQFQHFRLFILYLPEMNKMRLEAVDWTS